MAKYIQNAHSTVKHFFQKTENLIQSIKNQHHSGKSPRTVLTSLFVFSFSRTLTKIYVFLNGIFQFLRTDTNVSLCHSYTGMLEQNPHQLNVIMIIHIDICGKCLAETVRTDAINAKIFTGYFQML